MVSPRFHPGGIPACSRWLSAAIPPESNPAASGTPAGVPAPDLAARESFKWLSVSLLRSQPKHPRFPDASPLASLPLNGAPQRSDPFIAHPLPIDLQTQRGGLAPLPAKKTQNPLFHVKAPQTQASRACTNNCALAACRLKPETFNLDPFRMLAANAFLKINAGKVPDPLAANNPVFPNPATLAADAGLPPSSPEGERAWPSD